MSHPVEEEKKRSVPVFIYNGMERTGGIQSIIIREVRKLKNSGMPFFVICNVQQSPLGIPLKNCLNFDNPAEQLAQQIINRTSTCSTLDIIGFSPDAAALGYLLSNAATRLGIRARFAVTVLHPRDFMREQEHRHVHALNWILARAIGSSNLVFMNRECLNSHSSFLRLSLKRNSIVPVPIDSRARVWTPIKRDALRICSIGRIVQFKAYNFALPEIVAHLRSQQIQAECDIYGYGSDEHKLLDKINQSRVAKHVHFHGPIDLDNFDEAVIHSDVFIGMGTAAIQAAQLGVPTVLAVVDDPEGAHGFLPSANFGNLGERDETVPRAKIIDLIFQLVSMTDAEKFDLSCACAKAANLYVSDGYAEKLTSTYKRPGYWLAVLSEIYCRFYVWMLRDNWLRKTVRLLRRKRSQDQ